VVLNRDAGQKTMIKSKDDIRELLQSHGLRTTGPRLAVVACLAETDGPLSHSEVVERLGEVDFDPATVYRNLVKLVEVGLARVVSRAEGMARYELATGQGHDHEHAHFVCSDCGSVACLPEDVFTKVEASGRWAASVSHATIQLQGQCPECITH